MALLYLRVLVVFYHFKVRTSPSQIDVTSTVRISGPQLTQPQSTVLPHLRKNAGVLPQAATEAKNSSRV